MINSVKSGNTKHSWWNSSKAFSFLNFNTRDSTEKIFLNESLLLALFFIWNISVVLLLVCVHAPIQWVSAAMQQVSEHCGRIDVSLKYACLFTDSGNACASQVQLQTILFLALLLLSKKISHLQSWTSAIRLHTINPQPPSSLKEHTLWLTIFNISV